MLAALLRRGAGILVHFLCVYFWLFLLPPPPPGGIHARMCRDVAEGMSRTEAQPPKGGFGGQRRASDCRLPVLVLGVQVQKQH